MTNSLKSALLLLFVFVAKLASAQIDPGFTALQLENWDEAIKAYSDAVAKNPSDQQALLRLGSAYLGKTDKAKALENFKKAFDAKPDGAFAFIANGRVMQMENNAAEADRQFGKAAKAGKKDVNALRTIGESYLYGATRNLTRAEELLKVAYTLKTSDIQTLMQLGYCYKEMPNGGLAAQHYEFAQAVEPGNAFPVFMQARVYRQAKLPEKYIEYLGKTLAKDPANALAHRETAEFWYFTKRKYNEATAAYENLLAKSSAPTIDDEMQLANCYFITKKYDKCIALVNKVVGKDGSKAYLRRLLGYCYFETGDFANSKKVLDEYFKVVEKEKILASDYEYWAKSKLKTGGDTISAIADLRSAMTIDKLTWYNHKEIANLQYKMKNYCDAGPSFQAFLDSVAKPETIDFMYLGNSYYYCKADTTSARYEKALAAYNKATVLSPNYGPGWFWSGKAAAKLDPDMQTSPECAAVFGKAAKYFEEFIKLSKEELKLNEIAKLGENLLPEKLAEIEKLKIDANSKRVIKDMVASYEYLLYYHFLQAHTNEFLLTHLELTALDSANVTATGLKADYDSRGNTLTPPAAAPESCGKLNK